MHEKQEVRTFDYVFKEEISNHENNVACTVECKDRLVVSKEPVAQCCSKERFYSSETVCHPLYSLNTEIEKHACLAVKKTH